MAPFLLATHLKRYSLATTCIRSMAFMPMCCLIHNTPLPPSSFSTQNYKNRETHFLWSPYLLSALTLGPQLNFAAHLGSALPNVDPKTFHENRRKPSAP